MKRMVLVLLMAIGVSYAGNNNSLTSLDAEFLFQSKDISISYLSVDDLLQTQGQNWVNGAHNPREGRIFGLLGGLVHGLTGGSKDTAGAVGAISNGVVGGGLAGAAVGYHNGNQGWNLGKQLRDKLKKIKIRFW